MSQISLQIPQTGQPDSTEEAKVASDFTAIQNAINGGLDSSNLSATPGIPTVTAGLAANRPAAATLGAMFRATDTGQLSFDTGSAWQPLRLIPAGSAIGVTVQAGQYLNMTAGDTTATLPTAPPPGTLVCVRAGAATSGAHPVTVSSPVNVLLPSGAVTSFVLANGACVVLCYDGSSSQWMRLSGDQDTGWVALTLGTNVSNLDNSVTPSARLLGSRVWLQGAVVTTGAIAANGAIVTVASGHGLLPGSPLTIPVMATGNAAPSSMPSFTVGAAGKISTPTALSSAPVALPLYGISYDLSA